MVFPPLSPITRLPPHLKEMLHWGCFFFFSFAKRLLCQGMLVSVFIFISQALPPAPRSCPLWLGCCLSGFSPGSMYIIKTGVGFVGCQSINQSEFNYQASDGLRWQAPALGEAVPFGATAMEKLKMQFVCVCVCVCVCERERERDEEAKSRSKTLSA